MLKLLAMGWGWGLVGWLVGGARRWKPSSLRHFVSFLCFADKCSRAYAAHPHTCSELYGGVPNPTPPRTPDSRLPDSHSPLAVNAYW